MLRYRENPPAIELRHRKNLERRPRLRSIVSVMGRNHVWRSSPAGPRLPSEIFRSISMSRSISCTSSGASGRLIAALRQTWIATEVLLRLCHHYQHDSLIHISQTGAMENWSPHHVRMGPVQRLPKATLSRRSTLSSFMQGEIWNPTPSGSLSEKPDLYFHCTQNETPCNRERGSSKTPFSSRHTYFKISSSSLANFSRRRTEMALRGEAPVRFLS